MPNPNLEIFLKLDGIDGESRVKGHEKEIAVLSYEQAIDVAVIHSAGGGGTAAARAEFSVVRFRKNVDVASIPMLVASATGQHIAEARFSFRRAGSPFVFYQVLLEDILITHIAQRAGTGTQYPLSFVALDAGSANDGFLDDVAFDFSRIRWEHRAQRADGSAGTTTSGGWDVRSNRKL